MNDVGLVGDKNVVGINESMEDPDEAWNLDEEESPKARGSLN